MGKDEKHICLHCEWWIPIEGTKDEDVNDLTSGLCRINPSSEVCRINPASRQFKCVAANDDIRPWVSIGDAANNVIDIMSGYWES